MQGKFKFSFLGTDGRVTTRNWDSKEVTGADAGAEYILLAAQLESLRTAINAVTDANIADYGLEIQGSGAVGTLPADADISECASLQLDITPTGEPQKYATFTVPAPSDGVFVGTFGPTLNVVDIADADVMALVAELVANVLISDGEEINSMVSGVRVIKPYRGRA